MCVYIFLKANQMTGRVRHVPPPPPTPLCGAGVRIDLLVGAGEWGPLAVAGASRVAGALCLCCLCPVAVLVTFSPRACLDLKFFGLIFFLELGSNNCNCMQLKFLLVGFHRSACIVAA